MTWHCSSIYEDLHRYDHKFVFVIVSEHFQAPNNNKTNFVIISVQIFINPETIRRQMMAQIIENMDLSHIHLAVHLTIPISLQPNYFKKQRFSLSFLLT